MISSDDQFSFNSVDALARNIQVRAMSIKAMEIIERHPDTFLFPQYRAIKGFILPEMKVPRGWRSSDLGVIGHVSVWPERLIFLRYLAWT